MNEHTPLIGVAKYGKDDVEKALDGSSNNNTCSSPKKQHIAKIGMISSLALFVNELTGPGMLDFPATFQRCGFIPTSAVIIVTAALSAVCALNMANVISIVPNNTDFSQEVEYSATFRYYVGNTVFLATELVFFVAIMCQMIASIADTAQVVDSFLGNHIGTFGLRVSPGPLEFHGWNAAVACAGEIVDVSSDRDQNSVVPCLAFDDEDEYGQFVLTAGYVLSAIIFIPIGRLDLEGNMFWQEIAFYVLLFCSAQFIGSFLMNGIDFNNLPMWGEEPDEGEGRWDGLIGVVLFNFAIVTAVPSWLYEKSPTVNVEQAVRVSCIISSFLYIAVGALGALAIPNVPSNVLTALSSGELGPVTTLFSSVFTFFIIGFGIPLFSVLMRLNLVGSGVCSDAVGKHLTGTLPWTTSWLLYQGKAIEKLLSIGGLLTSLIVFIGPLSLALYVSFTKSDIGAVPHIPFFGNSKRAEQIELSLIFIFTTIIVTVGLLHS